MTLPVTIAEATPADLDQVWPLARDFATSYRPEYEAYRQAYRLLSESPTALLLLARDASGQVCGYALSHLQLTFLANGPVVWVEELMVDSNHRRLGVGRSLMKGVEEWARDHGAAYVSLATRRAAPFYLALQYDESATFFKKALLPSAPTA
ncbi:MAG TPA: GNAT family N-acetyltransferase [Propionibacteriaceae bacterium]